MHGRPSDASTFIPKKAQATFNVSAANSTLIMKTLTGEYVVINAYKFTVFETLRDLVTL